MNNDEKINLIGQKILLLSSNLDKYKQELDALKFQLSVLQSEKNVLHKTEKIVEPVKEEEVVKPIAEEIKETIKETETQIPVQEIQEEIKVVSPPKLKEPAQGFEEKIGAKWFSIVGIITLVLGIAIGVKYAIDQDLINETTRLVLGFLAGSIILMLAMVYKKKYAVFSAILLSGAMAVMYFTTYVGFNYYHFYGPSVAFFIMAIFTGFTVYAATIYDYEIIALIGLVGGYCVPPLLSTGTGEVEYMFGFMLILNLGVLALAFKKYWKFVNHVAYGLTWLIFASWMATSYKPEIYIGRTLFFSTAFYLVFYLSFIAYKIFRNKAFSAWDVILVMSNSLIYFGIGYNALADIYYEQYQGLFCVFNALIHLAFAMLCKKKEVADKTIFHFIIAMVISFITMAIPVQLDGNFVTIIWTTEMVILLWMSKRFGVNTYKWLAYGISLLAFFSLLQDWSNYDYFSNNTSTTLSLEPIMNHYFVTGLFAIAGFFGAWYLNKNLLSNMISKIANVFLLVIGILVVYQTFANEIILYFNIQYRLSETKHYDSYGYDWMNYDYAWHTYSALFILMYSTIFMSVLGFLNMKKFKNLVLGYITWGFSLFVLILNVTMGFVLINELKEEAVNDSTYAFITTWNYNFRYVFLPFVALSIFVLYQYRNSELVSKVKTINTWLFHIFILVVLSNELTHIIMMTHLDEYRKYEKVSFRMGYTVLWGLYSMSLIAYGIMRHKKMLRVIAIVLFAITIVKLAIDAMSMSRGYQLIVFITIGIILLLVGFMYQKFKPIVLADEPKNVEENKINDEPAP